MSKNKSFVCLIALLLVFSFALVGCGGGTQPAAQPAEQPANAGLPEVKWTMQTTWSQGWLLHDMAIDWADRVRAMTNGRFDIEVLPSGAIVGGQEVLDATHAGTIDAYHSWPGYWMGKHPAAPFFASIPMGLEPQMHIMWLYGAGGDKYFQEMMDEAGMNVVVWPGGVTHPEVLAHSNKKLSTINDFVGLKYRAPGWWGEMLKEMGVAVTMLPGTELYPSLERGILDATEFSSALVNKQSGFQEVTDYIAGPGMHQPTCFFDIGVNKDKYNALPVEYQEILKNAAMAMTIYTWSIGTVGDMEVLNEWKAAGETFTRVDDKSQHEFRELAFEWLDKDVAAKNNALYTKCWESAKKFYYDFVEFEHFMVPIRPEPEGKYAK